MIRKDDRYIAHSPHHNEQTAREWARCLEYDGAEVSVCYVDYDVFRDILTLSEKEQS